MNTKIKVEVICDSINSTWNVMTLNRECLHYGSAESCDEWLYINKTTHVEINHKYFS